MSPVLLGGRKKVKVKRFHKGKSLGGQTEGEAFEVTVTVKKGSRTRAVQLAEKQFFSGLSIPWKPFQNPRRQFVIMTELKRLNSAKKLGLHILPTIRLRKRFLRRPTLLLTRYKEVDYNNLSPEQRSNARAQRDGEYKVLGKEGYAVGGDAWKLIEDPVTKKPAYYIADFGLVNKISRRSKK